MTSKRVRGMKRRIAKTTSMYRILLCLLLIIIGIDAAPAPELVSDLAFSLAKFFAALCQLGRSTKVVRRWLRSV